MITTITLGGADKSGALARISAFLARHGYGLRGHHFTESASGAKLLVITLEGARVDVGQLSAEIRNFHPEYGVVDVTEEGSEPTPNLVGLVEKLAGQFPNVASPVRAYAATLTSDVRDRRLLEAGQKVGAFIYKKDWSLGSPLKMPVALRRTLVPALEKFCKVDVTDTSVELRECSLCGVEGEASCCEFITGFMQGFLGAGRLTHDTQVQKSNCRKNGDRQCAYTFNYAADS